MGIRNVRNFWAEVEVDGRENNIGTGPRAKDGSLYIDLKIREKGGVRKVLNIQCHPNVSEGTNKIEVCADGVEVYSLTVER